MENISATNTTVTDFTPGKPVAGDPTGTGEYLFRLIIHMIVFLLGVPGNCLILRVYWTKTRKTSTHVLIMALAWADLVVCLLRIGAIFTIILFLAGNEIPLAFSAIQNIQGVAVFTSFFITVIIAVDRYDCICRPHRRFLTPSLCKKAVFCALPFPVVLGILNILTTLNRTLSILNITAMALEIFTFFTALVTITLCYGMVYATIRKRVRVGVKPGTTRHEDDLQIDVKSPKTQQPQGAEATEENDNTAVDEAVSTFGNRPSTSCPRRANSQGTRLKTKNASTLSHTVLRSSHVTGKTLKTPNAELVQRSSISGERDLQAVSGLKAGNVAGRAPQRAGGVVQRKTTRMLFITCVVFLLTWLPYAIVVILDFVSYDGEGYNPEFRKMYVVVVFLYINNAVNPLIYGFANRQFRKDCKVVLRKMKLC